MPAFFPAVLSAAGIALLGLAVSPQSAVAQTTATATCISASTFSWAYNSEGDDPCTIAMDLAGVCIGTDFTLAPLQPGFVYLGPDSGDATSCRCSSVYYSLLSACAVCQDRDYITWTMYKSNCTIVYSQVFLDPLPAGVGVPHYAYLDVSASDDTFNVTAASTAGGPESSSIPQATTTSPIATASSLSVSSGGKKSNAGAIAGGVVGGLVALAAIGGLVFWLLRRNRASSPPAGSYDPDMMSAQPQNPAMTGTSYAAPSYVPTSVTPRIYDPNDPSTFPGNETGNGSFNTYTGSSDPSQSQVYPAQMVQHLTGNTIAPYPQTPSRPHYTGAPEL